MEPKTDKKKTSARQRESIKPPLRREREPRWWERPHYLAFPLDQPHNTDMLRRSKRR